MTFKTVEELYRSNLAPEELASRALTGEFDSLIEPDSLQVCIDEFGSFVSFSPRRTKAAPAADPLSDDERIEALRADV